MAAKIHVVRHAESAHNVSKDFSILDPGLTPLGRQQAEAVESTFPYPDTVGLIITSPLRRTIQTTLLAFPNMLDKRYYDEGSGKGIENGAELVLDPDLQERSALPCDTGSDRRILETTFPTLDFSTLGLGWPTKEGSYGPDDDAVTERAKKVRGHVREKALVLKGNKKRDIVIVTHGVFMKFLVGDPEIDLPKAGWKSFTIGGGEEGGSVFVPA
jgi:broad specificity phosphatase PhoE